MHQRVSAAADAAVVIVIASVAFVVVTADPLIIAITMVTVVVAVAEFSVVGPIIVSFCNAALRFGQGAAICIGISSASANAKPAIAAKIHERETRATVQDRNVVGQVNGRIQETLSQAHQMSVQ